MWTWTALPECFSIGDKHLYDTNTDGRVNSKLPHLLRNYNVINVEKSTRSHLWFSSRICRKPILRTIYEIIGSMYSMDVVFHSCVKGKWTEGIWGVNSLTLVPSMLRVPSDVLTCGLNASVQGLFQLQQLAPSDPQLLPGNTRTEIQEIQTHTDAESGEMLERLQGHGTQTAFN